MLRTLAARDVIMGASLLLASCGKETKEAERRYDVIAKAGSPSEKCDAARKVSAAWLQEQNQERYSYWKLHEDMECMSAEPITPGIGSAAVQP
jgi:hypothetical protein